MPPQHSKRGKGGYVQPSRNLGVSSRAYGDPSSSAPCTDTASSQRDPRYGSTGSIGPLAGSEQYFSASMSIEAQDAAREALRSPDFAQAEADHLSSSPNYHQAGQAEQAPPDNQHIGSEDVRESQQFNARPCREKGKLDENFHRAPNSWFQRGRVVRILLQEPAGNSNRGTTIFSDPIFPDELVSSKVRFFVIVNISRWSSVCLPISTYGGQGVAKPGLDRADHAIIYSHDTGPVLSPLEQRLENHWQLMKTPIRVIMNPNEPWLGHLHLSSRINYAEPRTVQHNWKVHHVGDVVAEQLDLLFNTWMFINQHHGQTPTFGQQPYFGSAGFRPSHLPMNIANRSAGDSSRPINRHHANSGSSPQAYAMARRDYDVPESNNATLPDPVAQLFNHRTPAGTHYWRERNPTSNNAQAATAHWADSETSPYTATISDMNRDVNMTLNHGVAEASGVEKAQPSTEYPET